MASHPGILSSCTSSTIPRHIVVGNGSHLTASCTGNSIIPTTSSSLRLNNILIAPQLVKNLISVRALTRDNSVSVEFDPWGFTIKDLRTRMAILRCDSSRELYPCAVLRARPLQDRRKRFFLRQLLIFGTPGLVTLAGTCSSACLAPLVSHVPSPFYILVMPVELVNMCGYHFMSPPLCLLSFSNCYTVMFGHRP